MNMTIGAGQFRSLGRLAVFHSLSRGAGSPLRNALETAIVAIRRKTGISTLYVFLTGSLAGGTGAGMFADIAHLVRTLAEGQGIPAKIRGYFVLPQAFDGTVHSQTQQRDDLIAKSFAAMRENARFAALFNYAEGYPIQYECGATNDPVLGGHVRSTLFELLYYFDGKRGKNSLDQTRIESGVAPTVAEEITAMIDERASDTLEQVAANVSAGRTAYGLSPDVVTVGSIGTYTWILPIYDIVETWTHTLAREVLDFFLQPPLDDQPDERTFALRRIAEDKAGARDSLNGLEAARQFWERMEGIGSSLGSLSRDLGRIGGECLRGPEARKAQEDRIEKRTLEDWLSILSPQPGDDQHIDDVVRPKVEQVVQKFLEPQRVKVGGTFLKPTYIEAEILTSDTAKDKEEKKKPPSGSRTHSLSRHGVFQYAPGRCRYVGQPLRRRIQRRVERIYQLAGRTISPGSRNLCPADVEWRGCR
ncbi:MAG: hypothetical protein HC884_08810 [Chloroflexaceae bacterium]|nr:hypothetical protein [Chloroflexaceae bacterium]